MTEFQRVRKQGSSLVLTIPKHMCEELRILPADHLVLQIHGKELRIRRVDPKELAAEMGKASA